MGRLRDRALEVESQAAIAVTDAGAARTLASGADRDVSEVRVELRAHTQALNALRETQREMGQEIRDVDRRMNAGFAAVDANFAAVAATLATVKGGIDEIAQILKGREQPE